MVDILFRSGHSGAGAQVHPQLRQRGQSGGRGGVLSLPRQAARQAGGQPSHGPGRQARLLQGDPQLWRILEIQTKLHEDFAITGKAPTNKTLC